MSLNVRKCLILSRKFKAAIGNVKPPYHNAVFLIPVSLNYLVCQTTSHICNVSSVSDFRSRPQSKDARLGQVRPFASDAPSGLYVSAKDADHQPFILRPQFDFETLLDTQVEQLKESLKARSLPESDLPRIIQLWKEWKKFVEERTKLELETKARQAENKLRKRQKVLLSEDEEQKLREAGKRLRIEMRKVVASVNEIEDQLYPMVLSLPNFLHPGVPVGDEAKIVEDNIKVKETKYQFLDTVSESRHENISTRHHLAHPGGCYLQGEAALMERDLINQAVQRLNQSGFTQFSCGDLIRPYALDALGANVKHNGEVYYTEVGDNPIALTGISPLAFYAYFMMSVVEAGDLPYRCFSVGRHYNSSLESLEYNGLCNHFQGSQVQLCCLTDNSDQSSSAIYEQFLNLLRTFYKDLNVQYRIVEVPSHRLLPAYSRQTSVQVWLPSVEEFREVGHVTCCGDFVSRRLIIRYPKNPKEKASISRKRNVVHTVHGTMMDCNILLDYLMR